MTRTDFPQCAVADLLDGYGTDGSFFFSSPRGVMLAVGEAAAAVDGSVDLPGRVSEVLAGVGGAVAEPVVVGAVPFAPGASARLVVPMVVRRAGPVGAAGLASLAQGFGVGAARVVAVPEPDRYVAAVERAVAMARAGAVDKVVLARCLQVEADRPVDVGSLLRVLAWRDPAGYTYAVDLPGGATLVGASPELLVSRFGSRVVANPMAGSRPRAVDPVEDRRRAAGLQVSVKDRREHAFVVEAVVQALRPYLGRLRVGPPTVVPTAAMWHLSSRVEGEVVDRSVSALQLAMALHPTPAVCGTPVEVARAVIAELEPFDRGFYTGMVGWVDAGGDGEWVVGIRCARVAGRSVRLYAGAGVVAESVAVAELAETSAKFRTMLTALGLAGGDVDG
ncbi:isochorismate synthase [Solwaraspora sp. WMMB335]|uniref:isochorismate synthase n=1 Tax=Solwaraspora sp. WMMB335 TaxID=3404118 RepID=UPI003B952F6E